RALVGKPDLLILDEPTSALDAVSEDAIQKTLKALHGKTTTIIIAHRLSMLEHCDRILVLQEGRIEAFDTPERLNDTSAFYRKSRQLLGA
ncbi:MAG: ABC transporter ATP-binding protein, partial [Deltaproteobacteria bacterium]|nr:ABC transporter ATP-binding protein [Deltaproteobacteria bacterium]